MAMDGWEPRKRSETLKALFEQRGLELGIVPSGMGALGEQLFRSGGSGAVGGRDQVRLVFERDDGRVSLSAALYPLGLALLSAQELPQRGSSPADYEPT